MPYDTHRRNSLSRRCFFKRVAIAAGGVALASARAAAQDSKFSKAEAEYQDTPKGEETCGYCNFFEEPDGCRVVEGKVHADGWCKYWAAA